MNLKVVKNWTSSIDSNRTDLVAIKKPVVFRQYTFYSAVDCPGYHHEHIVAFIGSLAAPPVETETCGSIAGCEPPAAIIPEVHPRGRWSPMCRSSYTTVKVLS